MTCLRPMPSPHALPHPVACPPLRPLCVATAAHHLHPHVPPCPLTCPLPHRVPPCHHRCPLRVATAAPYMLPATALYVPPLPPLFTSHCRPTLGTPTFHPSPPHAPHPCPRISGPTTTYPCTLTLGWPPTAYSLSPCSDPTHDTPTSHTDVWGCPMTHPKLLGPPMCPMTSARWPLQWHSWPTPMLPGAYSHTLCPH